MFLLLVRKEILSHILSLRFAVTFVLFMVLVFASIYVAVNEHTRLVERETAIARDAEKRLKEIMQMDDLEDRANSIFWWDGKTDAVPISPLSWLGQGVQASYPAAVVTKADGSTRNVEAGGRSHSMIGGFRIPDFVYVVNVVLSLLAVLFMFDAVCGEKESGTLRLVLSNAVPRHTVLLSKWIGGYIVLLVPFLVTVAGGLVYASARGVIVPGVMGRIVFLVFIAALYIAVFFNLSLFVSTTTRNSATSLLYLSPHLGDRDHDRAEPRARDGEDP